MKRVIILLSHPLFGRGVESLLRRETGLEIVGPETDADQVIEHIKELRPDVVIVDSAYPACDAMSVMMRIVKKGVGTRVIDLSLQDNSMRVYDGEERTVKEVKDLVQAIEQRAAAGASAPRGPGGRGRLVESRAERLTRDSGDRQDL